MSAPPQRRHWMDTTLQTRICEGEGGGRAHYQQLDYSTDDETKTSDVLLSSAQEPDQSQGDTLPWEKWTTSTKCKSSRRTSPSCNGRGGFFI